MSKKRNSTVSSWVGSERIPVRILIENHNVICKVYSYFSGGEKEFASYVKDPNEEEFRLIGKTKHLEQAKFFCNLSLKSMGYRVSLLEFG